MFRAGCGSKHNPFGEIAPESFRTVRIFEEVYPVCKAQSSICCTLMFHSDLTFKERQRCRDEAQTLLTKVLRMEANPLFTQNSADYIAEDGKWFSTYHSEWTRYGSSTVGSDTWTVEDEIKVMASVQAYFQVSHKVSAFLIWTSVGK